MSRPTAKQLDRMDTGFKFVGLDLCTHHPEASRYRYQLDAWIHSTSVAGRNVSEAIGKLVASALSTRQRHGGQHMSVPGGAS